MSKAIACTNVLEERLDALLKLVDNATGQVISDSNNLEDCEKLQMDFNALGCAHNSICNLINVR